MNVRCKSGRLLLREYLRMLSFLMPERKDGDLTLSKFPLSQKYIDFINSVEHVTADFLEGT